MSSPPIVVAAQALIADQTKVCNISPFLIRPTFLCACDSISTSNLKEHKSRLPLHGRALILLVVWTNRRAITTQVIVNDETGLHETNSHNVEPKCRDAGYHGSARTACPSLL